MKTGVRSVENIFSGRPTLEGAGVRLRRVFGFREVPQFDPFLMLDDFGSDDPADYLAGFPWHPHRGIETVTYLLHGSVAHGDSLENKGVIGAGEVQWMTAGGGIIHQEMPERRPEGLRGFQLWVNLPAKNKMMKPRYRGLKAGDIPSVKGPSGITVKVIAGEFRGIRGPVRDIVVDPSYFDVTIPAGKSFHHVFRSSHTVFAYVTDGEGTFDLKNSQMALCGQAILFGRGKKVSISAGDKGLRFLLISGEPIGEPIAWRGPIVMNTERELNQAFSEYQKGTFLRVEE
jgi:redox-sensitive bicupin YhaK (pirin superfamily)